MIRPMSFAIHVTYQCPLACAHCCFSSSPKNGDRLPIEQIFETIRQLDDTSIQMVAFTGGEPMLLGQHLITAIKVASERGFVTRVVTSAYFAKTPEIAKSKLGALRDAGLSEVSISWDDFHEEFVNFDCIYNAFWASKRLGMTTAVNTVQASDSRWTAERVRQELGLESESEDIIVESPLNLTGRAEKDLVDAGLRPERSLGPCPYVLTGPTLSAKNKLLACCGVIQDTPQLTLDDDFKPENLQAAIEAGQRSTLLNWLYLRGPYAIMEHIGERFEIPVPSRNDVGGNCEACRRLFHTPEFATRVEQAATEKSAEISGELELLGTLGMLSPRAIQRLWAESSMVVDTAPSQFLDSDGPTSEPRRPTRDQARRNKDCSPRMSEPV